MNLPYPILFWIFTGALFFFLELFAPAFILFFFGVGAWITAAVVWLLPLGLELAGQLTVFLAASLVSLFLLRRALRGVFQGKTAHNAATTTLSAATGSLAEVLVAIEPPLEGQIKFQGSFWRAQSDTPVAQGATVRIIGQDGLLMRVEAILPDTQTKMEE